MKLSLPKEIVNVVSPVVQIFVYDCSGSMDSHVRNMREAIKRRRDELAKQNEVNSIIIARVDFRDGRTKFYDITSVQDMDTSYNTGGGTPLYKTINNVWEMFCGEEGVITELIEQGHSPRPYIWIWSDGNDTDGGFEEAEETIRKFDEFGVTVSMVCFGNGARIARELGIKEGNILSCENSTEDLERANVAITQSSIVVSQTSEQIKEGIFDIDDWD